MIGRSTSPRSHDHPPLPPNLRLIATMVLGMASFMNILDLTIVNVSVPTIAGDLGVAPSQGTWTITSYAVAEAIMLPMTGWLAGRLGQVRLFLIATAMFTLASVLCGLAPSFEILLAARVLQGVFGAGMIPMSQTLMLQAYPPEKQGLATGIWAMTTVAAPIVGPLAGGWINDNLSWHWIFLINLPVGILCLTLVWSLFKHRETPSIKKPVDTVGLILLAIGVGSLQILLDKGNELDWLNSPLIVALAAVSALALVSFGIWEWYEEHPLVDVHLFTKRNFLVSSICMLLGTLAFFGSNVVFPLWLQTQLGYTAEWAGRTMALGGILAVFMGPIVGANINRVDARAVATFGFSMFALYAYICAHFTADVDFATLAMTRLIMGLGISCFFLPIITIGLSNMQGNELAAASGLNSFLRNMGSSMGTAIMISYWEHRAQFHHANLAENITQGSDSAQSFMHSLSSLGMDSHTALSMTNRVVESQAFMLSTNNVMMTCGILMVMLALPVWMAKGPFMRTSNGGGH